MVEGKHANELRPEQVRKSCDPAQLGFASTDELPEAPRMLGQQRAREAIDFALEIADQRYNLYVSGSSGSGRLTSVLNAVQQVASAKPVDADWCYVYHFERPGEPLAISLPAGNGQAFARDIDSFVVGCRRELRRAFESDGYRRQRDALVKEIATRHAQLLEDLQRNALEHGFLLQETPYGVTTIPLKRMERREALLGSLSARTPAGGKLRPLSPEEFAGLPPQEQQHLREEHDVVEEAFAAAMPKLRALEDEARDRVQNLDHDIAQSAVAHLADELVERYAAHERIADYIRHLESDVLAHADVLRGSENEASEVGSPRMRDDSSATPDSAQPEATSIAAESSPDNSHDGLDGASMLLDQDLRERPAVAALLRRYRVNVLVAHHEHDAAPVVQEINPTYLNLLGRIEFGLREGLPYTDHLMIKAGAFHAANGGYLILQARALFSHPFAWEAVKRVLRFGVIGIESSDELQITPVSASLRPEPIPAMIKVILIGDPDTYAALMMLDPEFSELFKVRADFDHEMARTPEAERFYGTFIADVARTAKIPPLTAGAVAAIIEEGSRWVEDQERLSTRLRSIQDLTSESGHFAGKDGASQTARGHVLAAIAHGERRMSLLSDKLDELIRQRTIMIDTTGAVVGQVNGLTVLEAAGYAFGKPARITARTSPGMAGIVNLERETQMSGPAHSKGILILTGYLAGRYSQDYPLSLSGSICFEQIYGEIEGDSASSAELYALLSSLSGLPLKQSLAVTGSVNQRGEVQAVGGVNQKIEGFFAVCSAGGLTGDQGVIIPRANARNLMLREEVVEAVRAGRFHIYAVSTIDEGIELLTSVPAGSADASGQYPDGTVNRYVTRTLRAFLERVRELAGLPAAARQL